MMINNEELTELIIVKTDKILETLRSKYDTLCKKRNNNWSEGQPRFPYTHEIISKIVNPILDDIENSCINSAELSVKSGNNIQQVIDTTEEQFKKSISRFIETLKIQKIISGNNSEMNVYSHINQFFCNRLNALSIEIKAAVTQKGNNIMSNTTNNVTITGNSNTVSDISSGNTGIIQRTEPKKQEH